MPFLEFLPFSLCTSKMKSAELLLYPSEAMGPEGERMEGRLLVFSYGKLDLIWPLCHLLPMK